MSKTETWRQLNKNLSTLTEKELLNALNYEIAVYGRTSLMLRMHQRYTKLRAQREREMIAERQLLI